MQRKIKGTVVVFLSAILCCTSCIDNDYDLNKDIDMSVSLGGDAFVVPIGNSEETRLDQIIDESETLKLDEEGRYSINKNDNIDDVKIDVNAVTIDIKDPSFEPIRVDFVKVPGMPEFSSDFDTKSNMEVHEENIDKAIKSLKEVSWEKNELAALTVMFDFGNTPSEVKEDIKFSNVQVHFPKFIEFIGTEGLDVENNILIIDNESFDPSVNSIYKKQLMIKGLDFTKIDENGLIISSDHILDVPEQYTEVTVSGQLKTSAVDEEVSQIHTFNVDMSVSVEKMVIGEIVGKFDPEIDPIDEEVDLDLGDDLDFLTEDGNEIVLKNPVFKVDFENPVGASVNLDLTINGYLNEQSEPIDGSTVTATTQEYPDFKIYSADKENGMPVTTHLIISREKVSETFENTSTDKYYNLVLPQLSDIMKRMPDYIKLKLKAQVNQNNEEHHIDISPDDNQDKATFLIKGNYDVSVPLTFETLNIHYTDTIDNLQDDLEDLLDVALSTHVELNGDFVNGIPIDLNINVEPTDANNNPLTNISTKVYVNDQENGILAGMSVDGQPSNTPIKIVLNSQDREELKKLDKLFLNINASASQTNSGITLKGAQTIQLKNMRLYVKKVNLDLN